MNTLIIISIFVGVFIGMALLACIIRVIFNLFTRKTRKMCEFVESAFKEFVSSRNLPQYDTIYGKPIKWTCYSIRKHYKYTENTGAKIKWYVATCMSIDETERIACSYDAWDEYDIHSNHMVCLDFSLQEYEMLKNGIFEKKELMRRFQDAPMVSGSVY